MSEKEYHEVIDRVRAIAGTCFSAVTEEEIRDVIDRLCPEISPDRCQQLIRECGRYVRIVTQEEKDRLLCTAAPEQPKAPGPDPALIDRFFCILIQREIPPKVKDCWMQALNSDPRYKTIMARRKSTAPAQLAKLLNISMEEFYQLEQEMMDLYYKSTDAVRKQ